MSRRRRKGRVSIQIPKEEPTFSGPIAVLLIGEDHTMTRQQLLSYLHTLITDVKSKRPKK